ncbi:MAG: FtsX-like permease family protein [Roseivirga sp.]|nr:FtsX-like permease family protein [Roseivirga sp.]
MFRNMFKIAWRNAIRQKQFTLLNIVGLSIGITACLLIALYVQDELSYDNFHEKGDRIYRVNQPSIWSDWNEPFAATGPNIAVALRTDIPEFEEVVRIHDNGPDFVSYKPEGRNPISFKEEDHFMADANFFKVFSFELLSGDKESVLAQPGSVVITEETAERYFGKEAPEGKILEIQHGDEKQLFTVTGVVENVPENSHLQFDMLSSMTSYPLVKRLEWSWIWTTFATYGLVKEGTDIETLTEKIQAIPPKWAEGSVQRVEGKSYAEYMADGRTWDLRLQSISDAYLYCPPSGNRFGTNSDVIYTQIFSAVGLLILVLSAINFMNLSTARSANRAKEVGIRKVLGSEKKALINQFIFESILFVSTSTILAMVITEFSLGAFNNIANKDLSLYSQLGHPVFIGSILSFMLVLGFLAGSYPAFYLSSFRPVDVLKGKISSGFKGKGIRNALVVFQFAISVTLIISTFFVQKQLNYAASFNLGFDNNNILQVHNLGAMDPSAIETFQTMMKSKAVFSEVGYSDVLPPNVFNEDKYQAYGPDNDGLTLNRIKGDEEYVNLLSPKILVGRNFDKTRGTDKHAVLLNASAVKALGWGTPDTYDQDSPIGKHVTFPGSTKALFEVIGVVDDFNFNSLRLEIAPLLIAHKNNELLWNSGHGYMSLRLNADAVRDGDRLKQVIEELKTDLGKIAPAVPFEYSFMDQQFEESFRTEQRMSKVLNIFTGMALTIACLGLFGLAAFSAEQRTKELGVRKVLGAKTKDLVISFSGEFTRLVLISLIIAVPLAYFAIDYWLADFAYKTPIQPMVFVIACGTALMISWFTISFQSLKAAYRNPVDSLRDE